MAATKTPAKKKTASKKAPAKSAITVTSVNERGIVVLSNGTRSSTSRGVGGFGVKIGDSVKVLEDGSCEKV